MAFEKSGPAASEQFTISRASLPSLLEWTERLQDRFRVKIDIQWELEGIVQPDTPQVRWVYLYGKNLEDCHAAKNYIVTFCDPRHKLNVTYPEDIDAILKSSQAKLEVKYSVVIQFAKIGQLLIKSQDEMNMMLVLSHIESCASELVKDSFLDSPRKSPKPSSAGLRGRHIKDEEPVSHGDDLQTDSLSLLQEEAPPGSGTLKMLNSKHELRRGPGVGSTDNVLRLPQDFAYFSSAISPDRKMMKSSQHGDLSPSSKPWDNLFTVYDLNSRQKLVVQRILQNGEFTKAQVERTLERVGSTWKCSDFAELVRTERELRNVPQTSSREERPSGDCLVDLKETQGSLMQSLEAPARSTQSSTTAESSTKRCSTPLTSVPFKDWISVSDNTLSESEDSIVILSQNENEYIVVNSSDELDTPETFYVPAPNSRPKSPSGEKELHGVVEGLRLQLKELQDKLEKDKQEQQQQFQEQLLEQEKKLKAEQGAQIEKQIQEQQLKKKETSPRIPLNRSLSENIVIAPAKRNKDSPLRPIVIDGSNVAMCHGRSQVFSCRGIAICVQYFQQLGHQDIMVFVPLGRRTQDPHSRDKPIQDQPILEQLARQGLLSFTPSRRIGHTYITCYDDRFIVDLAVQNDGVIVSNDNYRDLMRESPRWKFVIENRLVMFTFAGDRFMIPDDPLGRKGPRISQLLRKNPRVTQIAPSMQRLEPARRALAPAMTPGHSNHQPCQGPSGYQLMQQQIAPPAIDAAPRCWGAGSSPTAAHLFPQGSAVVDPVKVLHQKPSTAIQKLDDTTRSNAATFHPKLSPFFKTLQPVFPDNEAEVLKVLTSFRDVTELNELSLLVLAEIRDGAAKT